MIESFTRFRNSLSAPTQGVSAIMGLMGGVAGAFTIPVALRNVSAWQMFIHSGDNFSFLELANALVHAVPAAVFPVIIGAGSAWIISAAVTEGIVRCSRHCRQNCACCNRAPDPDSEDNDIEMQLRDGQDLPLNPPPILNSRQLVVQRALTGEGQDLSVDAESDQELENQRLLRLEN